jgi:uncharacterized membrane protein YhhN
MIPNQQRFHVWAIVFGCLTALHLLASAFGAIPILFFTKPLLVPALALGLLTSVKPGQQHNRLFLLALLFAWGGDVLLLFEKSDGLFFIAGLSSFLLAHLLFIVYFLRIKGGNPSLLKQQPWWALLVLAYSVGLLLLLFPVLGNMRIPVLLYAATITTMLLSSLHAFAQLSQRPARLFALGALFFVLSDSLLAINKFHTPLPFAGVWIMLTYCAALYCLAKGAVNRH